MNLKRGVKVDGLKPEALLAVFIAADVYASCCYNFRITSVKDGVHMHGSLHYKGLAFDAGVRGIPQPNISRLATKIRMALTDDYDVVVEKDHIHIEYDPKEIRTA